jgi:hypothetical protein
MNAHDWNLAVAVHDGDESVMVYLPRKWSLVDEVNVCVAVCDGQQLILISASLRTEPLMKLTAMHLPEDIFGG